MEYFGPRQEVFAPSEANSFMNRPKKSDSDEEVPYADNDAVNVSPRMSGDNEADWMLDQLHLPRRKRSRSFSAPRPISLDQAPRPAPPSRKQLALAR